MITFYILLGIGFIITIIMMISESDDFWEYVSNFFKGMISTTIISFILLIIFTFSCARVSTQEEIYKYTTKHELLSLNDNISISENIQGNFFLGSGYIQGKSDLEMYYVFYFMSDNGEIIYNQYKSNELSIYEDSKIPYLYTELERTTRYTKENWKNWVFSESPNIKTVALKRELHVPKGTVLRKYTLDLQ